MPQLTPAPTSPRARSAAETEGAAAGDLQWKLDLCQSPDRVVHRAQEVLHRHVIALGLWAVGVYAFDVALVLTR